MKLTKALIKAARENNWQAFEGLKEDESLSWQDYTISLLDLARFLKEQQNNDTLEKLLSDSSQEQTLSQSESYEENQLFMALLLDDVEFIRQKSSLTSSELLASIYFVASRSLSHFISIIKPKHYKEAVKIVSQFFDNPLDEEARERIGSIFRALSSNLDSFPKIILKGDSDFKTKFLLNLANFFNNDKNIFNSLVSAYLQQVPIEEIPRSYFLLTEHFFNTKNTWHIPYVNLIKDASRNRLRSEDAELVSEILFNACEYLSSKELTESPAKIQRMSSDYADLCLGLVDPISLFLCARENNCYPLALAVVSQPSHMALALEYRTIFNNYNILHLLFSQDDILRLRSSNAKIYLQLVEHLVKAKPDLLFIRDRIGYTPIDHLILLLNSNNTIDLCCGLVNFFKTLSISAECEQFADYQNKVELKVNASNKIIFPTLVLFNLGETSSYPIDERKFSCLQFFLSIKDKRAYYVMLLEQLKRLRYVMAHDNYVINNTVNEVKYILDSISELNHWRSESPRDFLASRVKEVEAILARHYKNVPVPKMPIPPKENEDIIRSFFKTKLTNDDVKSKHIDIDFMAAFFSSHFNEAVDLIKQNALTLPLPAAQPDRVAQKEKENEKSINNSRSNDQRYTLMPPPEKKRRHNDDDDEYLPDNKRIKTLKSPKS